MSTSEKRVHPRSEYFLIKSEGGSVPIYAFRGEDDLAAIPALVMDLSMGGVQVLTTQTAGLSLEKYELEIVEPELQATHLPRIKVAKIWQRKDGVNIRTGLAIRDNEQVQNQITDLLSRAPHQLLRCVLRPSLD